MTSPGGMDAEVKEVLGSVLLVLVVKVEEATSNFGVGIMPTQSEACCF